MIKKIKEVIETREETHGSYTDTANVAQDTKAVWHFSNGWYKLTNRERESLDLIATKVARILSGDAEFKDHWTDIAGYAEISKED